MEEEKKPYDQKQYLREWYLKNKDRVEAQGKKWRKDNLEASRRIAREGYHRNKEKYRQTRLAWTPEQKEARSRYVRDWKLKKNFGISLEEFERLAEQQGGGCAICVCKCLIFTKGHGTKSSFAVDHDHQTGKVRALLCDLCNRGLGMFKENPIVVQRAADYLKHHNGD